MSAVRVLISRSSPFQGINTVRRRIRKTVKGFDDKLDKIKDKVSALRNSESSPRRRSDDMHKSRTSFELPTIDPATPALRNWDSDEEEDDEHAFDHPSLYVDQPWIWIPEDPIGLSKFFVDDLKKVGISASDVGASMNPSGVVNVSRNPPDEHWTGGHDS